MPSTSSSAPLRPGDAGVSTVLTLTLSTDRVGHTFTATSCTSAGGSFTKTWRFTSQELDAALLNEIGAVVADLGQSSLLRAVGIQGTLAVDLLDAAGAIQANSL